MDEVPLSFDIPPTRTVDVQGARLFAAKTAADYTPLRIIRCFFYSKKRAVRIIRSCGLYTGKYDNLVALHFKYDFWHRTATAGSDVVQSGRPIFDDFFQHLWPYIGNNTANVAFQMVKRLWLIRIDQ
ncbi:adhesion G protein-coupled receptor B2 [Trichonephila clavipes]|nr:adhesion G protein-coupled receptor B2 [Trichonephila clavipes]